MAILLRRGFIPAAAAFDPATTAWVNAVFAVDGTVVGATEQGYVDTCIKSLKSNSIFFSTWDEIWLLANADNSLTESKVGIVNNKIWTPVGTAPTIATKGVTLVGANPLNSTINLSTAAQYTQNSAALAVYITTADSSAANVDFVGADNGSVRGSVSLLAGPARAGSSMNDPVGDVWIINPSQDGLLFGSRVNGSSTGETFYLWNAANPTGTNTASSDTSGAPPNFNAYIFARNSSGSAIGISNSTMSMAAIGSGLTSGQVANFNSAINAYMTSLGINIY
jgi:hypothetical protein